jgi:hypothetical protein
LRWHGIRWVQRIYLGKKYAFRRIQCQPAPLQKNHPGAVGGISILVDWTPYSLDFSISCVLQAIVNAKPLSDLAALFMSIAAEWDRLAVVYICKTCHSFRRRYEAAAPKNEV